MGYRHSCHQIVGPQMCGLDLDTGGTPRRSHLFWFGHARDHERSQLAEDAGVQSAPIAGRSRGGPKGKGRINVLRAVAAENVWH